VAKNSIPKKAKKKLKTLSDCIADVGVFVKNDQIQAAFFPDFKVIRERGILNIDDLFRSEIVDKYNSTVAYYKKIMNFTILKEELPKTRLGKLQRFKLADLAGSMGIKKLQTPERLTRNIR
jgi:long-chain acyl-CoA synthetase